MNKDSDIKLLNLKVCPGFFKIFVITYYIAHLLIRLRCGFKALLYLRVPKTES